MKKAAALIISGLLIIISGMILWQWLSFTKEKANLAAEPSATISQEIIVKVDGTGLKVKQVFIGLNRDRSYAVDIPLPAKAVECTGIEKEPCDKNMEALPKGTKLQFQYEIENAAGIQLLLNEWLISLKDEDVTQTKIEVIDQLHRKGTWASGLPLKGYKQTELLHYYVFEGAMANPALYWQEKPLAKLSSQRGIHFYTPSKQQEIYKFESLANFEDSHLSVVLGDDKRIVHGKGLLLAGNSMSKQELEHQLAISLLSSRFPEIAEGEAWVLEALASLITDVEPVDRKSKTAVSELRSVFSGEELKEFVDSLSEGGLTFAMLDQRLSSIKGMETKFFAMNRNKDPGLFPMLFLDSRNVVINGNTISEAGVIMKDQRNLFPLEKTMEILGFKTEASPDRQFLTITSGNSHYTFNLKNKTFIFNGESFGLLEKPFHSINGHFFIEKKWLNAIFKVNITEDEESIRLALDKQATDKK
ncbi:stalk domain-containing protein [Mesobacillus subterraneus]|uniref:Copper amine oxidase-like N-terminal domain-containing protein n=1 Tax=Mesobacillus subterraneus TaxID=285983 RepID=A0A3R9F200_9BACI|nr:stalk domain-containing protein [Mesobacillus subterraneus]RSD28133.1 hypothetical protein EJA10_06660 [Mesobacillus subterraneus]